jgi:hypothetical protein
MDMDIRPIKNKEEAEPVNFTPTPQATEDIKEKTNRKLLIKKILLAINMPMEFCQLVIITILQLRLR